MSGAIDVAVGVIVNAKQEVLISKRALDVDQGGLWEFPGGKVEQGETVEESLCRELDEELGVQVVQYSPFCSIWHDYRCYTVRLHCFSVTAYTGEPMGMEAQEVRWVSLTSLPRYSFPAANEPLILALCHT